ncbi:MAG: hypothetical protein M3Q98_16705 [Actinomycetota bacterium]|nr:hypothetical protein [Actinomycetota bacterium]
MIRPRMMAIAAAAVIALSGCGGSGDEPKAKPKSDLSNLSANALLAKAKTQIEKESSVTIKGSGNDGGNEIGMNISYVAEDASGTVTLDGSEMTLLKVGEKAFFKAGDDFWKAQAGEEAAMIISLVDGRWIKADGSSDFADLVSLTQRSFLSEEILDPEGKVTKGTSKKIDGVDCLALNDDEEGTLYVASDNGRPIRLVGEGESQGNLNFSYDEVDAPKAPASADVVDLAALGG